MSPNTTLIIEADDTISSGAPVTITAINDDNESTGKDGKRTVTVVGGVTPEDDDITVEAATLTIVDDDLAYGKVELVLFRGRIAESDDDADHRTPNGLFGASC